MLTAFEMWHMNHPGQTWEGKKDKPVAAAAFWWRESGGKAITPCKGGANTLTWGCMQFLDANGVRQPKSDITRDQVKTLDESQLSKIIKRETLRDMWCQQADNPERLEEPADNVPQGNPEPITQEELDQFEFETDIEFSD
jgi:hypothetical protein